MKVGIVQWVKYPHVQGQVKRKTQYICTEFSVGLINYLLKNKYCFLL